MNEDELDDFLDAVAESDIGDLAEMAWHLVLDAASELGIDIAAEEFNGTKLDSAAYILDIITKVHRAGVERLNDLIELEIRLDEAGGAEGND